MFNRTVLFYGLLLVVIIIVVHIFQPSDVVSMKQSRFDQLLEGEGGLLTSAVVSTEEIKGTFDPDGIEGPDPERQFRVDILPESSEPYREKLATYKKEVNPDLEYEAVRQNSWI